MKNKTLKFLAIIVLTALTGCAGLTAIFTTHGRLTSEAEDAYRRGDLDVAVRNTAKALTIKPEYEKAQRLLVSSFSPAILEYEETVSSLTGSKDLDALSQLVIEYQIMVELNRLVSNLPTLLDEEGKPASITFATKDFSQDLLKSKKGAAEAYYQEGNRLGKEGGLHKSRTASKHLKLVLSYAPGYQDAAELEKKYRKAGTKKVAIVPFLWPEDHNKYKNSGKEIVEKLTRAISRQNKNKMEYLNIVSYSDLKSALSTHGLKQQGLQFDKQSALQIGKKLGIHELIIGNITGLSIKAPETITDELTETKTITITRQKNLSERGSGVLGDMLGGKSGKDSVAKNAVDTDTVKEDIKITADINIYELSAGAKMSGFYNVINLEKISSQESALISGEYTFSHKWASFEGGDKRALLKETKILLKNDAKVKAPDENRIVKKALEDFSSSLVSSLETEIFSIEGYR